MKNKTTNEGVMNNSNQPQMNLKLNEMVEERVNDLTKQLTEIRDEIKGLNQIDCSDKNSKFLFGSTEVNIEDFMSEPDIQMYRNWLMLKRSLEGKDEGEVDSMYCELMEDNWDENWFNYVYNNSSPGDFIEDVWDYIDWGCFIDDHFDSGSPEIRSMKFSYERELDRKRLLKDYIKTNIEN